MIIQTGTIDQRDAVERMVDMQRPLILHPLALPTVIQYNVLMSGDLLQTKLYVPRIRSSLIPRPHLIEKLKQGLNGKLTLISAPGRIRKNVIGERMDS